MVELVEPAQVQHRGALAVGLDDAGVVRDQDEGAVLALLEQLDVAAVAEARVADRHALVDQEAVELDRHRQREREPHRHAVRIVHHRLVQVDAELGELLDERHQRLPVDAVDATNELQVVEPGQVGLERAGEGQRPAHAHAAVDAAGARLLGAAEQPDQRALAGSVAAQDADVAAARELEADVVQHAARPAARAVGLADALEPDHWRLTRRAASRSMNRPASVSTRLQAAM
jgi:hypothetical protein